MAGSDSDSGGSGSSASGVMAGRGFYEHNSATQQGAAARGIELLEEAAAEVAPGGHGWRVVDLGCAQGHNSLEPMAVAIDALQRRSMGEVEVAHTDLATNDWATFFEVIEHDPASYLVGRDDGVHPFVVGRSFYDRLFSPATVDLGWTSSTLHWLSRAPGPVQDHFFVQSSTDEAAKKRYRDQSDADWLAFLGHRSVELTPSGSLVFVDVLMGDDGLMGSEALFDALEDARRAVLASNTITAEEYSAMVYPTWFRTLRELRAPFDPTLVGSGGGSLELVGLEPATLDDPFLDAYRSTGDAEAYGRSQAGFLRGFLEPSFRTALAARPDADQQAVLDAIFDGTASRISLDPDAVSPSYRLVTGRLRRTS